MSRLFLFKALLIMSLVVSGCQVITPCYADVVSLDSDYVPGQAQVTPKLNADRHALTDGVNNVRGVYAGGVQSSGQIKADTVGEENMADDANSRIRTAEGASCTDFVASGFLPTTSASLVLNIPPGIAYPDGYRIEKTSSTAANLAASKWTYYYLLTSGSFATNVATIGSSTPTPPANSAVLFRASSDTATINTITDLRRTSCAGGPFSAIADATGEATLNDIFTNGAPVRRFSQAGRSPNGLAQGLFVSFDTATTFKVTAGSAYINGKYRSVSQDITVPVTLDDPLNGISGLDAGSFTGGAQRWYVYGIADQSDVKTLSVTFSTNANTPNGVTNSRLLGSINSDATNLFTSRDVITVHALNERETIGGWVHFNGTTASTPIGNAGNDAFNVSSITDGGTGLYTVTWDADFNNALYAASTYAQQSGGATYAICYGRAATAMTAGAIAIECLDTANAAADPTTVTVLAVGDTRK